MALGVVLAPYGYIPGAFPSGITQSRGAGSGGYNQPYDPYYNMRGEAGFFHDTALGRAKPSWWQRWKARRALRGLGAIPTDFEMAQNMGYTPVASAWVASDQGYLTPPWLPPDGWAQGGYPPPIQPNDGGSRPEPASAMRFQLGGLRDDAAPAPATADDLIATLNAHNDRVFALTLVSTSAVAISAMITIFRTLRLIRSSK
jgi:hypothetical protein